MRNKDREERRRKNRALFEETSLICQDGCYEKDKRTVSLGLTPTQMATVRVLLPEEVKNMPVTEAEKNPCAFSCENIDALSLVREKLQDPAYSEESGNGRILVLNMASAVHPGGGVRDGMGGQEEDLCRHSTLLMSLESEAAKPYYEYNKALHSHLGSDGMILTPDVAVFRDEKGELLEEPFLISVLTCAAPNVRFGFGGRSKEAYRELLYDRIESLLRCAGSLGYRNFILGAFGCGAFRNDPALVSDDFYQVLTGPVGRGLAHADFAVLCTPGKEQNFNEFNRNFSKGS